mmetsp:Transcript_92693/g.250137  ORF Transcript_92693/g.250137 Transcript_92693/m.250137 type:complete len:644 (+) Transcript_92693:108-2039(+)
MLYTRKDKDQLTRALEGEHEATTRNFRDKVQMAISPVQDERQKKRQQVIDLRRLLQPAGDATNLGVQQERQFLEIALRSFARSQGDSLISKGRRTVLPASGHELDLEEVSLAHGRQLWWGWLAQIQLVAGKHGMQPSLSLNLVPSVALPSMEPMDLLAALLAETVRGRSSRENHKWFLDQLQDDKVPREFGKNFRTLNSEAGLRKVKVCIDYFGHLRKKMIVGVTETGANQTWFWLDEEKHYISVADYFLKRYNIKLDYPSLPCLMLTTDTNFVPIELVKVLGGEHNILVGKLRQDYQKQVTAASAMPPARRRSGIENVRRLVDLSPANPLEKLGLDVAPEMMKFNGRILTPPALKDGTKYQPQVGNYANSFKSIAPPKYDVEWGLWSFCWGHPWELTQFADTLCRAARSKGLRFAEPRCAEQPEASFWKFSDKWHNETELKNALFQDLRRLQESYPKMKLLVVALPDTLAWTGTLRSILKYNTETGTDLAKFGLVTQCVLWESKGPKAALDVASSKVNNLLLNIVPKLAESGDGKGSCHNVQLVKPHELLIRPTMILGADVTHHVHDVSIAGVVATRDEKFVNYFSELRGQAGFDLSQLKERRRKSEERIIDLADMVAALLKKWRAVNSVLKPNRLPDVILY